MNPSPIVSFPSCTMYVGEYTSKQDNNAHIGSDSTYMQVLQIAPHVTKNPVDSTSIPNTWSSGRKHLWRLKTHSITRLSPRKMTLTFPFLPSPLVFLILTLLLLAFLLIFPWKQSMSIEAGQGIDGANAYHGTEPLRPLLFEESHSEKSKVHEEAPQRGRALNFHFSHTSNCPIDVHYLSRSSTSST